MEQLEFDTASAQLRLCLSKIPESSDTFPILICTFNNPTFLKLMINQIERKGLGSIIILDSNSTYPEMISSLLGYEKRGIGVLRFRTNVGPRFLLQSALLELLPQKFILTDPDLELSVDLGKEHLCDFDMISQSQRIGKVGCSLSLKDSSNFNPGKTYLGESIEEWESKFWKDKVDVGENILAFAANLDTTFSFYNQKYFSPAVFLNAIRVDSIRNKDISARHLPWYLESIVPTEEIEFYMEAAKDAGITSWGIA